MQLFRVLEQLFFGLGPDICLFHSTQVNFVYQLVFLMLGLLQQFFELLPLFLLLLQLIDEHLHFLAILFLFKNAHLPFELVVVFSKKFVGLSRRLKFIFEGFEGSFKEIDFFSPLWGYVERSLQLILDEIWRNALVSGDINHAEHFFDFFTVVSESIVLRKSLQDVVDTISDVIDYLF